MKLVKRDIDVVIDKFWENVDYSIWWEVRLKVRDSVQKSVWVKIGDKIWTKIDSPPGHIE